MHNNNKITTDLALAVRQLKNGELVAFATETVYGLGADASNPEAIKKVFAAKGRPVDHPLIVHIAAIDQLSQWAREIPAKALTLAQHFWPGPLTMIFAKQPWVSELITGSQDTIAIRMPRHPLALKLLQEFGGALVGPSANKYGRVSPTTATHVAADLGDLVAAILDGGSCEVGIESTIVDFSNSQPRILRHGAITAADISKALQQEVLFHSDPKIRTPGNVNSHYAPRTKVKLVPAAELLQEISQQQEFSVISFQTPPVNLSAKIYWQQVSVDPQEYAHNLYANLRQHDQLQNSLIIIEQPPHGDGWLAINDRLCRASQ